VPGRAIYMIVTPDALPSRTRLAEYNLETVMQKIRRFTKPISTLALVSFFSMALPAPLTHAAMIGTDKVVSALQDGQARDSLRATLEREDVKQKLRAQGVNPEQLQARVDALTDPEIQQLAAKMDQMPAGGDVLGVAVLVFLVLLVTDILGYTDIFPFVKKTANP
jgi:hypothetical protein